MKTNLRLMLIGALLFGAATLPVIGQGAGRPKVVPKLEPVAETKLLMEGLAHANFRGLERHLTKNPIDDASWTFARGQALLIAETANLLMLRPPRNQGENVWFERAMDMRSQAQQLAQQAGKKDLERSKAAMQSLATSCNRCHQTFKIPVEIVPFQAPDPPPLPGRKVSFTFSF
jgi:hypothetical protein